MKIIKMDHVPNGTDNIYDFENFYSVALTRKDIYSLVLIAEKQTTQIYKNDSF